MEQKPQRTIFSREENLRRQVKGEGVDLAAQLLNGKIKPGEFAEKWAEGRMREIKDHLTGLFSRRVFEAELKMRLAMAARNDRPLALLMVDVDSFKEVNDNFGHQAGDEVLRRMGRAIAEITRESDVVARYGGEEVVVILPETDEDGAEIAAERLRKKLRRPKLSFKGGLFPVPFRLV